MDAPAAVEVHELEQMVDCDKEAVKKLRLTPSTPSSGSFSKWVIGLFSLLSILALLIALTAVILSGAHWTQTLEVPVQDNGMLQDLKNMLQELNRTVQDMQVQQETFVGALNIQLSSLNNSIVSVQDRQQQQVAFVETLNTQVASLNDSIVQEELQKQQLEEFVETVNAQVAALNNSVITVQETQQLLREEFVETVNAQVAALNNSVITVQETQQLLREEFVETLNTQVTSLSNSIETVQDRQLRQVVFVDTLNTQIDSLNNSIVTKLASIKGDINTQADNLDELAATVQVLGDNVTNLYEIGFLSNFPASSCNDISTDRPSGLYWIQLPNSTSSPVQIYCDTSPRNCSCNSTGGWMRVANIDMTDPTQTCPDEFQVRTSPRRVCVRPDGSGTGCVSTTFPVHGIEYSRVCGRIIGYSISPNNGFLAYRDSVLGFPRQTTIDGHYLDGFSLTHGSPGTREHIWSFAAAFSDNYEGTEDGALFLCQCNRPDLTFGNDSVPPFVGNDYFCDTALDGVSTVVANTFISNDPLWDGAGCNGPSICCEFNNPPWFCKQLPQPTTDDIEMRLCELGPSLSSDVPFEMVEMYVN